MAEQPRQSGVAGDCSRGGAVFFKLECGNDGSFSSAAFAMAVSRAIGIDSALLTVSCGLW
jgi:hypothetical protein